MFKLMSRHGPDGRNLRAGFGPLARLCRPSVLVYVCVCVCLFSFTQLMKMVWILVLVNEDLFSFKQKKQTTVIRTSSSSLNKQSCLRHSSEIVDISAESHMRTALVKSPFDTVHRVSCHYMFRQRVPKVHYQVALTAVLQFPFTNFKQWPRVVTVVIQRLSSKRVPYNITIFKMWAHKGGV